MFLSLITVLAAGLGPCKVENAVYEQRSASSITAEFVAIDSGPDWPSNLAMKMYFGGSNRTYWWLPWNGGTSGQQHLASTWDVTSPTWQAPSPDPSSDIMKQRPLGDVSYIGMDASYNVIQGVPRRGELAPAHFFIPDLREALWYRTASDARDSDARQLFDLVGCAKAISNDGPPSNQ